MASKGKLGARVFLMDGKTIFVLQTVRRGTASNDRYVIDGGGKQDGVWVDPSDDKEIGKAIRNALNGKLYP